MAEHVEHQHTATFHFDPFAFNYSTGSVTKHKGMNLNQTFSILFCLNKAKMNEQGFASDLGAHNY